MPVADRSEVKQSEQGAHELKNPARLYTTATAVFSLLQGTINLAFRMIPALDHAFPALLATTRMVPVHAVVHILTGALALTVLLWGGERGPFRFAVGFGSFYIALAVVGMTTGRPATLGLQPFDHPIHLAIGGLGLLAAVLDGPVRRRRA